MSMQKSLNIDLTTVPLFIGKKWASVVIVAYVITGYDISCSPRRRYFSPDAPAIV
jgi:hypothetical protein